LRFRTLVLSLIPGVAHVSLGRPWRGLLYFALFVMALNATFLASLLLYEPNARLGCALASGGFWLLALTDAMRLANRGAAARKAAHLAAAMAGDDESKKTRRVEIP
jgi:predicted MFS family arabinose efflux permease